MEEPVGARKWTTTNHNKNQSSSHKGDVVYMMGLEGSLLSWAPSGKPNDESQQVVLQILAAEGSTQWKASGIKSTENA